MITETKVTKEFIKEMKTKYETKPEGQGLLEACADNVVLFSKYMLNFPLYAWQIDFLTKLQKSLKGTNPSKEFAGITSRQIGKTEGVVAIFGLWCIVFNKAPMGNSENTQVLVVSASDKQSRQLITRIKRMMRLGDAYMKSKWGYEEFYTRLIDDKGANNTEQISFKPATEDTEGTPLLKNSKLGSQIVSYPPTSKVLGETASIIIVDEAGKTDKIPDTFIEEYLSPVGDANNALKVYISTPWVLSGFFYRIIDPEGMYEDSDVDKVMYTIDAIQIENPEQYETVIKKITKMNADGKTAEVQRAYYCRFVKGESTFFSPDSVRICFENELEPLEKFKGECDLGVDFGGFGANASSKTVFTISYLTEDNEVRRIFKKTYPAGQDKTILSDIEELYTRFNIQRIIPDDCPAAQYIIPEMQQKGWIVTPMSFASEKTKKYGAFRALLNRGKIQSFEDEELRSEMFALEVTQGVRNMMIKHAAGYNDDEIDSFVLSAYHYLVDDSAGRYFDMDEYETKERVTKPHYDFGW